MASLSMKPTARQLSEKTQSSVRSGHIKEDKVRRFKSLVSRIENEIIPHPVITNNEFTAWFSKGEMDRQDVRHFFQQFSVFSNLFIEAQLKKTINAPTLEAMRASKEILMNELGVVFRSRVPSKNLKETDVDPELVGTEGTVEGGTFRFAAAHFEWLLRMVPHVGLTFENVGTRKHGTKSTLFFCDELARLYGSQDPNTGLGASFGVENWAAAGFWKELVSGLEKFRARECPQMPLAFFTWHDRVEDQHAAHTWDELEEEYFSHELDERKFIQGAMEMLAGVKAFWDGLNDDRLQRSV